MGTNWRLRLKSIIHYYQDLLNKHNSKDPENQLSNETIQLYKKKIKKAQSDLERLDVYLEDRYDDDRLEKLNNK